MLHYSPRESARHSISECTPRGGERLTAASARAVAAAIALGATTAYRPAQHSTLRHRTERLTGAASAGTARSTPKMGSATTAGGASISASAASAATFAACAFRNLATLAAIPALGPRCGERVMRSLFYSYRARQNRSVRGERNIRREGKRTNLIFDGIGESLRSSSDHSRELMRSGHLARRSHDDSSSGEENQYGRQERGGEHCVS